jgi:hypothetical protein
MSVDVGPEEAHARAERGNARLAVAAVFFQGNVTTPPIADTARVRGSVSPKREIGGGRGLGVPRGLRSVPGG